jgi:hypothetical protein
MTTSAFPELFDPVIELDGVWTVRLAEKYLPIAGAPQVKFECVNGYLSMSQPEPVFVGYAVSRLWRIALPVALKAHVRAYPRVSLLVDPNTWIEPDFAVLPDQVKDVWGSVSKAVMVGEFSSPASPRDNGVDRAKICAVAGVPYYLVGQIDPERESVSLRLDRLVDGEYRTIVEAEAGEQFSITEPLRLAFDPVELLDR